jgi:hypothetical protein
MFLEKLSNDEKYIWGHCLAEKKIYFFFLDLNSILFVDIYYPRDALYVYWVYKMFSESRN